MKYIMLINIEMPPNVGIQTFDQAFAACIPVYEGFGLFTRGEVFDAEFQSYFEDNRKRFLDDGFLLFTQSQSDLKKLQELLNSLNPSYNLLSKQTIITWHS